MMALADEMPSVGTKLEDEELVSYLTGLDLDFNLAVSVVVAWIEPILVGELYT